VINVADGPPLAHARAQVATVCSVFPTVVMIAEPGVLRGRRTGNLVLVAGDGPLPAEGLIRRAAADPFPARVVTGAELARFTAGASPVTDNHGSITESPDPLTKSHGFAADAVRRAQTSAECPEA
jgi:hypothetical protein